MEEFLIRLKGLKRVSISTYYLDDVKEDMLVGTEEIFGPVHV